MTRSEARRRRFASLLDGLYWTGCMRAGWMTPVSGRSWTGTWPTASTATATRWRGRDSSPLPAFTPRPGRRGGRYWLRRRHRLRGRRAGRPLRQEWVNGPRREQIPSASRAADTGPSHRLQRPPHRGRRKAMGQTADTTLTGGRRLACSARYGQRAGRQRLARLAADTACQASTAGTTVRDEGDDGSSARSLNTRVIRVAPGWLRCAQIVHIRWGGPARAAAVSPVLPGLAAAVRSVAGRGRSGGWSPWPAGWLP